MAVRGARLLGTRFVSALAAGGILTGSLLLGGGTALAQTSPTYPEPAPTGNTVPAQCGDSVTATAGDQVLVTPLLGVPFTRMATAGMDPITKTLGGVLCQVDVSVVAPAGTMLTQVAPEPLKSSVGTVTGTASSALRPVTQAPPPAMTAPAAPMVAPAPMATPLAAPMPAMTPQQLAAGAPMFAPAFASLPAGFLASATAPSAGLPAIAPAGRMMDPAALFGSSFPGLRAGAPAYLGYDPASAVTTASQVQALPVDGLPAAGGIGLPVLIAVLGLAGVAAFAVRRSVLGSRTVAAAAATPGAAAPSPAPATGPAAAAVTTGSSATTRTSAPKAAEQTVVTDAERTVVTDVERTMVTKSPAMGTATA